VSEHTPRRARPVSNAVAQTGRWVARGMSPGFTAPPALPRATAAPSRRPRLLQSLLLPNYFRSRRAISLMVSMREYDNRRFEICQRHRRCATKMRSHRVSGDVQHAHRAAGHEPARRVGGEGAQPSASNVQRAERQRRNAEMQQGYTRRRTTEGWKQVPPWG